MEQSPNPQIVTQQDIADALGISRSTVAMALNPQHEHKLLPETSGRIKAYAKEVGYRPQRYAQIMRGGRTHIVGVIARMGQYTSNHELIFRLANELNHAGYRLVLVDPQWFGNSQEDVKNYLLDQAVEGVIFCNLVQPSEVISMRDLLPAGMPIVSLQSSLDGVPTLRADVEAVYQQLTCYHLALGSQKLNLLSMYRDAGVLDKPGWTILARAVGYTRAIQSAGGIVIADEATQELLEIRGCKARVPAGYKGIIGRILAPEKTSRVTNAYENGFHQTLRMIDREDLPDSLICMNDDTALGALAACADRRVSVPEDVRISGYDDTPAGQFGMVPLTSVRKPLDDLTKSAAKVILQTIQNPKKSKAHTPVLLPCEIVIRRSSATEEENRALAENGFFKGQSKSVHFDFSPEQERQEHLRADYLESINPRLAEKSEA